MLVLEACVLFFIVLNVGGAGILPWSVAIGGGLGLLLGLLTGTLGAHLAAATWLDVPSDGWSLAALGAGLVVVLAGLLAVLLGMYAALQEPLSEQVRSTVRPGPAAAAAAYGLRRAAAET